MSFSSMLKDSLTIHKANGETVENVKGSVQKNKIFIQLSDILIEAKDIIKRAMSNGGIEEFEVIEPGIRYYRYPLSTERNIEEAVKLYSGDKPKGLFVDKLESNLNKINTIFDEITELFANAGIDNLEKLPEDAAVCGQFVKLFKGLNDFLDAAQIQGFVWSKLVYDFSHGQGKKKTQVTLGLDETIYLTLVLRYKELASGSGGGADGFEDVPFDISGHLTEIDTGKIDADYMNSRFDKYLTIVGQGGAGNEGLQNIVDELHKSFATLTQEEQKFANLFLNDVQRGAVIPEVGKPLGSTLQSIKKVLKTKRFPALLLYWV